MPTKNNFNIPLDKFIDLALYDKEIGYYMNYNPFGKDGDFITAPNLSRMFSEMIAIWIIGFWENLGSPKNFNLVELGAGNGSMMKILIETFKKFPNFIKFCNIIIHEKSPKLIKIQKKELIQEKIIWVSDIKKIKNNPTIFIANEFFDKIAIKQFVKIDKLWFEKYVNIKNKKKPFFLNKKIDMKKFEKKIDYGISKDQSFVRTGSGGEKIVMGGGALVIPIIHDITVVNMNAIPIEIRQQGEQALITKNKMRVDIIAEFFVRVAPSEEAVSTAARTLGARTQDSMALKEVIQGRLIDALAAITASLTIEDIHSNRGEFIKRVF